MVNKYWIEQEKKFLKAIKNVKTPNSNLDKVDFIKIKNKNDLNNIPNGGGCYWIWTDEPVYHTLHKHPLPKRINSGEIIYNGIAKDDVKRRILHHLFGDEDAGWSGISIDIYKNNSTSHRKKAMSAKGKVPYLIQEKTAKRKNSKKGVKKGDNVHVFEPIRTKKLLKNLFLSEEEKDYINSSSLSSFYFRNGIDISEDKHKDYVFKVYFITGLSSLYLEYIEKKWRENGLPRLCSYSTGR
jgi:hypothetical protein